MRTSKPKLAATLLLVLVVAGCTGGDGGPQTGTEPPLEGQQDARPDPPEQPPAGPPPTEASVQVRVIDENEFSEVLAGYKGKVVLVDFWATWCFACIQQFPHTVALHERFADDGLAVISVSFDQTESKPEVLEFLTKQGATFDNFISRYGAGAESPERFGLPGFLPQLLLFDRHGQLAHTFPEPQSAVNPEQVEQAVKDLLNAAP